jgi:hypothetical protein
LTALHKNKHSGEERVKIFTELNRQCGLDQAAANVAEQLRQSGYLAQLLGSDHAFDLLLRPDGDGDGFFTLVCAISSDEGEIKPTVAGMIAELASEMFFEQLKQRCSPPDVDNIQGYLLDCEVLINGNPLERDV